MTGWFKRRPSPWTGIDFLTLRPRRLVEHETDGEDDRVALLVPRFRSGLMGRFLQPRLRPDRAHVRVRLEERGTWLWHACDGRQTVADLVAGFEQRFPEDIDEARERVAQYLLQLERNRLVRLETP